MIKYFSPTCRKVCTNICHSHAFEYLSSPTYIELWMGRSFLPTYYFTIILPTKWHQHHCYHCYGVGENISFGAKPTTAYSFEARCVRFHLLYLYFKSYSMVLITVIFNGKFSLTGLNSKSRWIDQKWFINRLSSGCWIKNIWPPVGSVTWFDKNVTISSLWQIEHQVILESPM